MSVQQVITAIGEASGKVCQMSIRVGLVISILALASLVGLGNAYASSDPHTASEPRFEAQTSDDYTITMSLSTGAVDEYGEETDVSVDLTLSATRTTDTAVRILRRHGTAGSSDASFTGATVTIAAGSTTGSGTVKVTPTDDEIVEGTENFDIIARVGSTVKDTYDFQIHDDDSAQVSISGPTGNVSEGGNARFTVTLSHAVSKEVSVGWSADAIAGEEVGTSVNVDLGSSATDVPSGTVTFAADSGANSKRYFNVAVFNDKLSEPEEAHFVQLENMTTDLGNVTIDSSSGQASVTIAESDPLTVSISGPTGSVTEGNSAEFTVSLSPQGVTPTQSLTVEFATSDGTATSGASTFDGDYVAVTQTVSFPSGSSDSQSVLVATNDDSVDENSKRFTGTISDPSGGGATPRLGARKSATATIADNDDTPTSVTLSATDASVSEGGDAEITITAELDSPTDDDTTVTLDSDLTLSIRFPSSTASSNDYSVTKALTSVTIPARQTSGSGTLTVAAADDELVEGDETIAVSGSARGFTFTPAHITIEDADRARASIRGPTAEVAEGSAAQFTVTLTLLGDDTKKIERALTVGWSADDDNSSATAAATDFGPQGEDASRSGDVTFPANSVSGATRTFSVATQNDNLSEPSESFYVKLDPVTGDFASVVELQNPDFSVAEASATIAENDPPIFSVSGPSASVTEGGNAEFTISLSGGVPTQDLRVDYTTSDGTAEDGTDYTLGQGTVLFVSGSTDPQTVTVSTTDDTQDESDETFSLTLSNPYNSSGPTPTIGTGSATATIADNDDPPTSVTLSANPSLVREGGIENITITATLDGSTTLRSDLALTIFLPSSSASSSDYRFTTPLRTLTIKAGESSGSGTLPTTVTDDEIVEDDETITVSGRAQGFTVTSADITIADYDHATLSVSGPSGEVTEGSNAVFTVTLSQDVGSDVTVALSASTGSAADSDFGAVPSTVTFAAGSGASATRTVSVSTTDDDLSESAETFDVSLGTITGDLSDRVSLKSGEGSASATIAASDPITVSLAGPATVEEGSNTTAYTVSLSGGTPTSDLNVDYATSNGTAIALFDYTAQSGTLPFTASDHADKTFTVSSLSDSEREGDETFTVALSNPSGGGGKTPTLGNSSVTTTIEDVTATLSVNTTSLSESASATDITVTATLDGGKRLASDLIVYISLVGTADLNDYSAPALDITIAAGEASGSGTLTITPTDDGLVEGDETITVTGNSDPSVAVSSTEITITDNHTATLRISGPSGEVTEGSNAVFTVTLSHSVDKAVTVALSAESGGATSGSDFGAVPSQVIFAADSGASATRRVSIPTTQDELSENAEDFSVSLGTITSDLSDLVSLKSGGSSASATIAASDPITVSLSGPSVADERGHTAAYTVSLSGGTPTADLTVDYATSDGTAEAGSDYAAQSGTLTFTAADHDDKTISVQATADTETEGDETFTVTLSNVAGGGGQAPTLGTSSVSTTLQEVGITLSVGTTTLSEGASATDITVTATLDEGDKRASDVTVSISLGGTAGSGDYSAPALSITIDAGESSGSGTLTITPTDDAIVEHTETIIVGGVSTGIAVSSAEITLTDNDTATLSISGPSGEVTEGSNAVFTITLSNDVDSDISVAVLNIDNSAIVGADMARAPSPTTFTAGSGAGATRTVSVAILDDHISEDPENFSLKLGSITGDLASKVSLKSDESSARATIALNDLITFNVSGLPA